MPLSPSAPAPGVPDGGADRSAAHPPGSAAIPGSSCPHRPSPPQNRAHIRAGRCSPVRTLKGLPRVFTSDSSTAPRNPEPHYAAELWEVEGNSQVSSQRDL